MYPASGQKLIKTLPVQRSESQPKQFGLVRYHIGLQLVLQRISQSQHEMGYVIPPPSFQIRWRMASAALRVQQSGVRVVSLFLQGARERQFQSVHSFVLLGYRQLEKLEN